MASDCKVRAGPAPYTVTPPSDELHLIVRIAAAGGTTCGGKNNVIINGVAWAYFNAPNLTPSSMKICEGDFEEGWKGRRGELLVPYTAFARQ